MDPLDLLPPDHITYQIQAGYEDFLEQYSKDTPGYSQLVKDQLPESLQVSEQCTRNSFYLSLHQFERFKEIALARFKLCATLDTQAVDEDKVDNTIHTYSHLITILGNPLEQQQVVDFLKSSDPNTSTYRRLEKSVLLLFYHNGGALPPNPDSMILLRLAHIILCEQDQTFFDSSQDHHIKEYIIMKLCTDPRIVEVYRHYTPPRTKAFIFLFILMHDNVYHSQAIPLPYWLKKEIFEELMSFNTYDFYRNHETLNNFIINRGTNPLSHYHDALINAQHLLAVFPLIPPPPPPPPPPHHNGHGGGNKKSKKRKRILRKRKSNKHKVVQRKMQREKTHRSRFNKSK